jgi:hypothetical protein
VFCPYPLQSEETRTELSWIAWVLRQVHSNYFISSWYRRNFYRRPSLHKPTSLLWASSRTLRGIQKFTLCDTFLDLSQVQIFYCGYMSGMVLFQYLLQQKPLWSGKHALLLRTVHPTDSYYAKSGRTSEYRSIGVADLSKKGERDDTASAYVLRPLKPFFVSIYGRSD